MSWLAHLTHHRCPPGWKLTRAASGAVDPRTDWHIMQCPRCATEHGALLAVAQEAKAAASSPEKLSREAREAIGARLRTLVAAPRSDRPQWARSTRGALIGLALGVPAIAAASFVWMGRHADRAGSSRSGLDAPAEITGESRATIRAIGPARFSRAQFQPDEIVRVDDGEIELEIAPLHAHERFRVVAGDGEVEVRGTRFKVSVIDHHLAGVHVWKGQVEVRSDSGAQAMLVAGDDWVREAEPAASRAETEAATSPPAPATRRRSPAVKHHVRITAAVTPAPKPLTAARDNRPLVEVPSFGHAWSLLRGGDAEAAAAEFAKVEQAARGRDIEEDALYWRAVAVGRAGDAAGARTLFAAFLERFPSSSRAGEAAAALGQLLLDAGDRSGARRAFERAARDPSPQVRAAAQDGLVRTQAQSDDQDH